MQINCCLYMGPSQKASLGKVFRPTWKKTHKEPTQDVAWGSGSCVCGVCGREFLILCAVPFSQPSTLGPIPVCQLGPSFLSAFPCCLCLLSLQMCSHLLWPKITFHLCCSLEFPFCFTSFFHCQHLCEVVSVCCLILAWGTLSATSITQALSLPFMVFLAGILLLHFPVLGQDFAVIDIFFPLNS